MRVLNKLFTPRHLALAVKAGACQPAVDWVREHPGCTWGDLRPRWRGWYALHVAAARGWYAQARHFLAESNGSPWWSGRCAQAAAARGDYAQARRFRDESDDPAWWAGRCAGAAAKRGDEAEAARFRKEAK